MRAIKQLTTDESTRLRQLMNKIQERKLSLYAAPGLDAEALKKAKGVSDFDVLQEVAYKTKQLTGFSLEDLRSNNRRSILSEARKVFIFLASEQGVGTSRIGRFLNRDHSTVIYQLHSAQDLIDIQDPRMMLILGKDLKKQPKTLPEIAAKAFEFTGVTESELKEGYSYNKGRLAVLFFADINYIPTVEIAYFFGTSETTITNYRRRLKDMNRRGDKWLEDLEEFGKQWAKSL